MPSWHPSKLRALLFRGSDWLFSSDGQQFSLSMRSQPPIKGPLLLIQAFAYRRQNAFPAAGECRFAIPGLATDKPLQGLKPAAADEIKRHLNEHLPASLASHGRRAQQSIDQWQRQIERRIRSSGMIDDAALQTLAASIPLAMIAGLPAWSVLFKHPMLPAARKAFPTCFPTLGQLPGEYLTSQVERHNREVFDRQLADWSGCVRAHVEQMGWIGRRSRDGISQDAGPAPALPDKPWSRSAPAEFQPSPIAWIDHLVSEHNIGHEAHQLVAKRPFFDRVERNPLTEEQARAVICMDDELLVVAAAGSGKSSTIVAKAGYALEEGLCAPEEILLLAFNSDAAEELRQRIADRLGHIPGAQGVVAKTFHAFGLDVIGAATEKMPTTAPWLDKDQDVAFVGRLIDQLCAEDARFMRDWHLFRLVYFKGAGKWDETDEPEDFDPEQRRKVGFRTMRNEIVKSKSERLIADWLFLHGVEYQYEAPYCHDTRTTTRRQYRPDFYYPDIDAWHEHLALDGQGRPPKAFESYLDDLAWKREQHRVRGTTLFETTSHELRNGAALDALKDFLEARGMVLTFDPHRPQPAKFPDAHQPIAKLIRVFQQHMKGAQRGVKDAEAQISQLPDAFIPRFELFLRLYADVSDLWEARLQAEGYVDFEDMLNQSAVHIAQGRYPCRFKMVLADEFQDTSRARMRLIEAVVSASGAQFTAVGDDWQGIYRFAGADIALMSYFTQQFPHASQRALSQTFRCPQDLCDFTSGFISKNPMQLAKEARSSNARPGPSLKLVALPDADSIVGRVKRQLEALHSKVDPASRLSVLLLGRYRKDRPAELAAWQARLSDRLELRFLTVHRAKGLEADVVLVLNALQGTLGFPSQMEDDPILQLAMPDPETFPFGEERRLFYVALTRAKRSVVIYTTVTQPSEFIVELQADFGIPLINVDGVPQQICAICGKGTVIERVNRQTRQVFVSCSRFPRCSGKPPRAREQLN